MIVDASWPTLPASNVVNTDLTELTKLVPSVAGGICFGLTMLDEFLLRAPNTTPTSETCALAGDSLLRALVKETKYLLPETLVLQDGSVAPIRTPRSMTALAISVQARYREIPGKTRVPLSATQADEQLTRFGRLVLSVYGPNPIPGRPDGAHTVTLVRREGVTFAMDTANAHGGALPARLTGGRLLYSFSSSKGEPRHAAWHTFGDLLAEVRNYRF